MASTDFLTKLTGGDRDRAFAIAARRLGLLMAAADTGRITQAQFQLLCQLSDGVDTSRVCDAKAHMLGALQVVLGDQEEFRADIADKHFAGDTPASRAAFARKLDEGATGSTSCAPFSKVSMTKPRSLSSMASRRSTPAAETTSMPIARPSTQKCRLGVNRSPKSSL
ncbi:MAG: hypothetical protein K2Y27_14390 [Xanthobacteraceae bacterium]|nr:hypothetical protein [Xanthobacteraceae bacterium]